MLEIVKWYILSLPMVNIYVLLIFWGGVDPTLTAGRTIAQVQFPYRAECEYAAKRIAEQVPGNQAFCFDVRVAGDRHEEPYTQSSD